MLQWKKQKGLKLVTYVSVLIKYLEKEEQVKSKVSRRKDSVMVKAVSSWWSMKQKIIEKNQWNKVFWEDQ